MVVLSGDTFVIKRALGLDLSSHYNRLVVISVDIINGVYCRYILSVKVVDQLFCQFTSVVLFLKSCYLFFF